MNIKNKLIYVKNIMLPCLFLSLLVGVLTGISVFIFKIIAGKIISSSKYLYTFLNENKIYIIGGIVVVIFCSLISYLIYKYFKTTRGGGIPTSIGILRGLLHFKWLSTLITTIFSSFITFFIGLPLGNEGPSVMIGTSLGRGVSRIGKKNKAWDRYIMTSGACSGFTVATSSPISGIFFALEEAHQRFSPMIIMSATASVMFSLLTMDILSSLTNFSFTLFLTLSVLKIDIAKVYLAMLIGITMGLFAVLFSKMYDFSNIIIKKIKIKKYFKFMFLFLITFSIGIYSYDFISTGHDLIEKLFNIKTTPSFYILLLILLFRCIMTLTCNNEGVTGGLFIPTLTIGAIISSLLSLLFVKLNLISDEYYQSLIAIGIACALASMIKTPITAIVFAIEALNSLNNITFIIVGVAISYIITEIFNVKSFNEQVIENRVEKEHLNKKSMVIDTYIEVKKDSFVIGKTIRDIFWPNNLFVLSITHNENVPIVDSGGSKTIHELDTLHIRFETYDLNETLDELFNLVGKQELKLTKSYKI